MYYALPVAVLSVLSLAGWVLESPYMVAVVPGWSPMHPWTAIAMLSLSVSLVRRTYRPTAWAAFAISLIALCEYLIGEVPGFDLVFPSAWYPGQAFPGRVPPNTAAAILFLSIAVLVDTPGLLGPVAVTTWTLTAVPVIGYGIQLKTAYSWAGSNGMAVNTVFALQILSLAAAVRAIREGWAQLPSSFLVAGLVASALCFRALIDAGHTMFVAVGGALAAMWLALTVSAMTGLSWYRKP